MALTSRTDLSNGTMTTLGGYFRDSPADMYRLLMAYYENNDLYARLRDELSYIALDDASLKALQNPAGRAVEFYPAKLWPGNLPDALPIVAKNEAIIPYIRQVWTWSNWASRKQVFARWLAIYGDGLLKVAQSTSAAGVKRVYLQCLDPACLTDFTEDERGYLQYIRLDSGIVKRDAEGVPAAWQRTEVWDKALGTYRVWEHKQEVGTGLEQLGTPVESRAIAEFGIDFIPIVHARFRDTGKQRGVGCFTLALDKIDEVNRMATRLHQMLFRHNRVLWALRANMVDATGRPMPAPVIPKNSSDEVELGGDVMLRLPGNSTLEPIIPAINYADGLAILKDYMLELEKDLPELAYYRLREMGELSGVAVRFLLSDTIDRALEVRGNAEAALVRADEMALTIGERAELWQVGNYEAGALEHTFAKRDIFPLSGQEVAQTMLTYTQAGVPTGLAAKRAGWNDEEVAELEEAAGAEEERKQNVGTALLAAFEKGNLGLPQEE